MVSIGSLLAHLLPGEKKARVQAVRRALVEHLAERGQRAFSAVASRTGLAASDLGLSGELRAVPVSVQIAENDEGLMTRFSATARTARAHAVSVGPRPRGLRGVLARGDRVGDPELDAAFATRATDADAARAVLDERGRALLLSMPDRAPIYLDVRGVDVTLDVSGVELDPDRLLALIEWVVDLAASPGGAAPYRQG